MDLNEDPIDINSSDHLRSGWDKSPKETESVNSITFLLYPVLSSNDPCVAHREPHVAHKEPHVAHSPDPRVALCEPCVARREPGVTSGTDVFYSAVFDMVLKMEFFGIETSLLQSLISSNV